MKELRANMIVVDSYHPEWDKIKQLVLDVDRTRRVVNKVSQFRGWEDNTLVAVSPELNKILGTATFNYDKEEELEVIQAYEKGIGVGKALLEAAFLQRDVIRATRCCDEGASFFAHMGFKKEDFHNPCYERVFVGVAGDREEGDECPVCFQKVMDGGMDIHFSAMIDDEHVNAVLNGKYNMRVTHAAFRTTTNWKVADLIKVQHFLAQQPGVLQCGVSGKEIAWTTDTGEHSAKYGKDVNNIWFNNVNVNEILLDKSMTKGDVLRMRGPYDQDIKMIVRAFRAAGYSVAYIGCSDSL
jgi:hypothetical protein